MIYLAFSKFGQLRIGNAKPEFKTLSWFAMLFSAEWGLDCCFGVFQSLFIIFLVRQWPKEELLKQLRKLKFTFLHWGFHGQCMHW
jgi:choline/glycine/proline betaine transport protein